jgi:hypothetical protein
LPAGRINPPPPNRRHLYHTEPLHSPPCRWVPEGPRTDPPCVFCSPALFSACSQHTGSPAFVWCVCRPTSTFQRHSSRHLLHYWSPSSSHLVPVCRQLQRAYYLDFARVRAPRGVPSGFVQRTGCGACGLGYPHQVWWAPPMYTSRAWCLAQDDCHSRIECLDSKSAIKNLLGFRACNFQHSALNALSTQHQLLWLQAGWYVVCGISLLLLRRRSQQSKKTGCPRLLVAGSKGLKQGPGERKLAQEEPRALALCPLPLPFANCGLRCAGPADHARARARGARPGDPWGR